MFGFFRRRRPGAGPAGATMFDEANSPQEREFERVDEHVSEWLEAMRVDVRRRRFVGRDGAALGIGELVGRIHAAEPDLAADDIEQSVTEWLEQSYCPEGISEERMEKLQAQIEDWVEAHYRADRAGS